MAAPAFEKSYSPEEYLALEREAEYKSEYVDGHIVAMTGGTKEHSLINASLAGLLDSQLRERPCNLHVGDMSVRVSATGSYFYPDLVVVCGEPEYVRLHIDTLLNPTVVIEVLSPSTEAYDRGLKFVRYRQLPSLQEYVLVSQNEVRIEHYVRQAESWMLTEANRLDQVVTLPSISCELPLAEVYRKVEFAPEA